MSKYFKKVQKILIKKKLRKNEKCGKVENLQTK